LHRPFYTASRSRADTENRFLREQIHPLLARYRVALVLSGHDHLYQRFAAVDGVHYVVAGGGGKSIYELVADPNLIKGERDYGFVLCDVDARALSLRASSWDGRQVDSMVITR
jgi:hypothetical protein